MMNAYIALMDKSIGFFQSLFSYVFFRREGMLQEAINKDTTIFGKGQFGLTAEPDSRK